MNRWLVVDSAGTNRGQGPDVAPAVEAMALLALINSKLADISAPISRGREAMTPVTVCLNIPYFS